MFDSNMLVEFKGINTNYSPYINCFKEELIEDIIQINQIPPMQYIVKFSATITPSIDDFIKTPKGINCDGLKLTGIQALVRLILNFRVEYITTENSLGLYTCKYLFNSYIALPEYFENTHKVNTKSYIQHIDIRNLDNSRFYFNLLCLNTLEF